jgi:hypothetical protein
LTFLASLSLHQGQKLTSYGIEVFIESTQGSCGIDPSVNVKLTTMSGVAAQPCTGLFRKLSI